MDWSDIIARNAPGENAEPGHPDFSLTRRAFIGSVAGTTAALSAGISHAQTTLADEASLDFVWTTDTDIDPEPFLEVQINTGLGEVERRQRRGLLRRTTDPVKRKELEDSFGTFASNDGAEKVRWRLFPKSFGPDAKFILLNRTHSKRLRPTPLLPSRGRVDLFEYEIRVVNAQYGRVTDREVKIIFRQSIAKAGVGAGRLTPVLEFLIAVETTLWDNPARPTGERFRLEAKEAPDTQDKRIEPVLLRDFLMGSANLIEILKAERISSTMRRLFNGLVDHAPGASKINIILSFNPKAEWLIKGVTENSRPRFTAFSDKVRLSELRVFWLRGNVRGTKKIRDSAFVGIGKAVVAIDRPVVIRPRQGPGLQMMPVIKSAEADPERLESQKIYFRIETKAQKGKQIRAEALWQGRWRDLRTTGSATESSGPFPMVDGALLERVDEFEAITSSSPAEVKGSLSFQGTYPNPNGIKERADNEGAKVEKIKQDIVRLASPIGAFVSEPVRTDDDSAVDTPQEPFGQFPIRRGQPVLALFNWDRRKGSRRRPITQWFEGTVSFTATDIALEDAEYSQLRFEPSELQILYTKDGFSERPLRNYVLLGGDRKQEVARLDLGRANLRASRSSSLISLVFRFSDLALSFHGGTAGAKKNLPEIVRTNEACALATRRDERGRWQPHDTRPTIAVDFPGQHLFEEAKFVPGLPPMRDVQLKTMVEWEGDTLVLGDAFGDNEPPVWSKVAGKVTLNPDNPVHVVELLRDLDDESKRNEFRKRLTEIKSDDPGQESEESPEREAWLSRKKDYEAFASFAKAYREQARTLVTSSKLPEDQTHYIGAYALDVDAMRMARNLHERQAKAQLESFVVTMFNAVTARATPFEKWKPVFDTNIPMALRQEARLEQAFPSYQQFRTFYRDQMTSSFSDPVVASAFGSNAAASLSPEEVEFFIQSRNGKAPVKLQRRAKNVYNDYIKYVSGADDVSGPVRARLAAPSRLAFRVNCRDGVDVARIAVRDLDHREDAVDRLPRKIFLFQLNELTSFHGLELAVTKRAETIYDAGLLGQIDSSRPRVINPSAGAMLDRLGFTDGPYVTAAQRMSEIASSLTAPTPYETAIEIPARLTLSPHQNAVVLTSSCDVADIFDRDGPVPVEAVSQRIIPERLWSAEFMTGASDNGLDPGIRAVHSPDLRPDFLWQRFHQNNPVTSRSGTFRVPGGSAPPRGPLAPWFLGRQDTQRGTPSVGQASDAALGTTDAQICGPILENQGQGAQTSRMVYALCKAFGLRSHEANMDLSFRGPTDAYIRHELVLLSSAWGLPVVGRRDANNALTEDSSQLEPEDRYRLADVKPGTALYRPRSLSVAELSLTSLGGTFRHDTGFQPPAAAHWADGQGLYDSLSIERWQQWTNLGRDIFCEVIFKGFLFPLGIRASLVQVTERTFFVEQGTGRITATLRQRMFIRVADPDRKYPAIKQPFEGRRFPVQQLKLLTTTTPDIVDPNDPPLIVVPPNTPVERDSGRVDFTNSTGLVFWPRTARVTDANVRFEMDVDSMRTDLPMMFVDNTAANDQTLMKEVVAYYNSLESPDHNVSGAPAEVAGRFLPIKHRRSMNLAGAKVRYAPELESGTATFETDHWTLRASGVARGGGTVVKRDPSKIAGIEKFAPDHTDHVFGPFLQGADQPPFYPAVDTARLRLSQTERLTGRSLRSARAHFDARYLKHGFPEATGEDAGASDSLSGLPSENTNDVFMVLRDALSQDMGEQGDQSGGVFRPQGFVSALSRKKGTMTRGVPVPLNPITTADDTLFSMSGLFSAPPAPASTAVALRSTPSAPASLQEPETVARDQDAMDKIREVYTDFFSEDAKILGLVKIRDLIALIQELSSTDEGLPELKEAIQFGSGALDSAQDVADTGAEAVREKVVAPMAEAARIVREEWQNMEAALLKAQDRVPDALKDPISVADVFPELDRGLKELAQALSRAEAETDPVLFALELGACYSAGQRFLTAVKISAANPLDRVEAALRSKFDIAIALFRAFQGNERAILEAVFKNEFKGYLDRLEAKIEAVAEGIADAIVLPNINVNWRRLELIALPSGGAFKGATDQLKTFTELFSLVPEDLQVIFKAFIEYVLHEIVKNPLDVPKAQDMVSDFLKVKKGQEGWIKFTPSLEDQVITDLQTEYDTAEAKLKGVLKWKLGADKEAQIDTKLAALRIKFEALLVDEVNNLAPKDNAKQLQYRYLIRILKALSTVRLPALGGDPNFPGINLPGEAVQKTVRALLEVLDSLLDIGEDAASWLAKGLERQFAPFANALGAIKDMFGGVADGFDVEQILDAVRRLLGQFELPEIQLDGPTMTVPQCKKVFDPVWQPVRRSLAELAKLGATDFFLCDPESDLITIVDVAGDWPALPAGLEDDRHLCTLLYRGQDLISKLKEPITTGSSGETLMKQLDDLVGELPGPNGAKVDLTNKINNLKATVDSTNMLLDELRNSLRAAYVAGVKDTAALNTLNETLAEASKLDPCQLNNANDLRTSIKQILALKNLPRDFQQFVDAREAFLKSLADTQGLIVLTVKKIIDEEALALPLLVGVFELLSDNGLIDSGSTEFKLPAIFTGNVGPANDVLEKIGATLEPVEEFATSLTVQIAEALCFAIGESRRLLDNMAGLRAQYESDIAQVKNYLPIAEIDKALGDAMGIIAQMEEYGTLLAQIKTIAPGGPSINLSTFAGIKISGKSVLDAFSGAPGNSNLLADAAQDLKRAVSGVAEVVDPFMPYLNQDPQTAALLLLDNAKVVQILLSQGLPFGVSGGVQSSGSTMTLPRFYNEMATARDQLHATISRSPIFSDEVTESLLVVSDVHRQAVNDFRPDMPQNGFRPGNNGLPGNGQLWGDAEWLKVAADNNSMPLSDPKIYGFLREFTREWGQGKPTPLIIFETMSELVRDVLQGDLYRLIDFAKLRDYFEEYLLSLVPSKISMGYDFSLPIGPEVSAATAGIFAPGPGSSLTIDMIMEIDLNIAKALDGEFKPKVSAKSVGTLGPFDIKLVGDFFDALTLKFNGARFEAGTGRKPSFDIEYDDYIIGAELEFMEDLQSFLSPKDGSGAFVTFNPFLPGVEAGYRLALGDFSVGTMAFSNVSLETSAILPFSNDEALFKASLSSRMSPFTLTYAPYGGSGFFAIYANTGGIIGFEASFETGGSAVFAYGPLNGKGRLMAGVYLRQIKTGGTRITEISMTFFVGGSASIWIFSFSTALSVKLGMINGNMTGEAIFTFGFSMGIKDFNFTVKFEKKEEKGFNGQSASLGQGPTRFASLGNLDSGFGQGPDAYVKTNTTCQSQDWRKYQTYFQDDDLPKGYF